MKRIITLFVTSCLPYVMFSQEKKSDTVLLQPIEIKAVRANDKAPITKTNLTKKEIEKMNLGQDLPFLLNQTPSIVANSDAGNGLGYTGFRIRGSDATRINMTINGIPYNDAESQNIFFVDLPDIASSANSIQIQRGVGTSTNGAGAFGGTINLSTNEINDTAYAELSNGYGSFDTWKHTLKFGSGLLGNHFTIDGRISKLKSDGYVDRAFAQLRSFYVSSAYLTPENSLRLNIFSGTEKTYQSWYGVSSQDISTNRTFNAAGTEKTGEPYNNQTDNYRQTHYQLFYNHKINNRWAFNTAVFLTKGMGYYEEYKAGQKFNDYGLPNYNNGMVIITETDMVRQLWLDNDFYGGIFSVQQQSSKSQFTLGGGWNKYDGKHYGIVAWAQSGVPKDHRYYNLTAHKQDFNIYSKLQHQLSTHWQGFADIQARKIKYDINGFKYNPSLLISKQYFFLNPKFGIAYNKNNHHAYLSYSMANKEPNRDDFEVDLNQQPKHETLHDIELGIEKKTVNYMYAATAYYMHYNNQLVLTGKINNVGAYTRTNTPSSYRLGIELQGRGALLPWLNASGNIAFSKNKIKKFTAYIDDYDNGGQLTFQYNNPDISFSPSVVAASSINFLPVAKGEINFLSKYVGEQFLDNTSSDNRKLNSFYVHDVRLSYTISKKILKEINFTVQVNNIFNKKYEPNGYTFSYFYSGSVTTENYYFPMAGTNFMAAVNIKL